MVVLENERLSTMELPKIQETASKLSPEDFLSATPAISSKSLRLLKSLYDLTKSAESELSSSAWFPTLNSSTEKSHGRKKKKQNKNAFSRTEVPLPTLIVEDFGSDQIWEEIQLQNTLIYETLVSSVSKVLAHKTKPKLSQEQSDSDESEDILNELQQDNADEDGDFSDFFDDKPKNRASNKSYKKSIVDDKFFNLEQMTEFLEQVEAQDEKKSNKDQDDDGNEEDNIDYFKDDEEDAPDYFYKDFFDPPHSQNNVDQTSNKAEKSVRFNLEEEEDEAEDSDDDEDEELEDEKDSAAIVSEINNVVDDVNLSTFEKKRRKIEENIKLMEDQALEPKSWHLTGEVTAETRPENSLLEEHLIYDHLLRQAPEITVKTTQRLEDIIKQRIKDQGWDDVIRKIKPIENIAEYKKRLVLDAEKSKMSLTDIYEKEYVEKTTKQDEGEIQEEQDPEKHQIIQKDMAALFAKLDALSHFHFTPKMLAPEIKTITNAPAVTSEEVAQTAFSDAMLLAPQEITAPAKGEIKGNAERSSTDKKRERRLKKKKQHLKRLAQEEKARAKGLGLRNIKLAETVVKKSKKGKEKDEGFHNSKELKSSKAFFAKLQEQVSSHINKVAKRKPSADPKSLSAKKFKL